MAIMAWTAVAAAITTEFGDERLTHPIHVLRASASLYFF
jgi:hypothetical protein